MIWQEIVMQVTAIAAVHMSRSDTDTLSGITILTQKVLDGESNALRVHPAGLYTTRIAK